MGKIDDPPLQDPAREEPDRNTATAATILVVDDTIANVRLLSTMLGDRGYRVRKATSGKMALNGVKIARPDLILLDITMPEMNGYEVCRHLKSDPETQSIPVIFISALGEATDKVEAFATGGVDYITKPFHLDEVLARVETHLKLRQLQKQLEEKNALLQREQELLQREQEKTDRLLANILPQAIAERLKEQNEEGGIIVDRFEEVTVLFADIVGFTPLAERLPPIELVGLLDRIFSSFDELAGRLKLEKIKTIGDAYMVAAGLPVPRNDGAEAIAEMALLMQAAAGNLQFPGGESCRIRIGIDTGSVVAGVIGRKKFIYDLWGDTANVASRMESLGVPGKIQATQAVRDRLAQTYLFEERGEISVKGKGSMVTYWLAGRKVDFEVGSRK